MLPKLDKKIPFRRIDYLKTILNKKENDDGFTNKRGMEVIVKMKDYLQVSACYYYALCGICSVFDSFRENPELVPLFEEYGETYIFERVQRILGRMAHSLNQQRWLCYKVKNKIKVNAISAAWEEALNYSIENLYNRLHRIFIITEENLKITPLIFYTDYLAENTSLEKDIEEIVSSNYGESLDFYKYKTSVVEHIDNIILEYSKNPELLKKAREEAHRYNNIIEKRKNKRQIEKEEETEKRLRKFQDNAREIIFKVGNGILQIYNSSYTSSGINRLAKKGNFFILGVIKIYPSQKKEKYNVVYASQRSFSSSCIGAKKFYTFKEAEEARQAILSSHEYFACEIIEVQITISAAEREVTLSA